MGGGAGGARANPATAQRSGPRPGEVETLEIVKMLVEAGADVNAMNVFNRTRKVPWAVPKGQVRECVDVETPDQEYYGRFSPARTALGQAQSRGLNSIVEYLKEKGAIEVPGAAPRTGRS